MIILLSPAKSFDFDSNNISVSSSEPDFVEESTRLVKKMRSFSGKKLGELMSISPELASLNVERYQNWTPTPKEEDTKHAIFAFNGEAYRGLDAASMSEEEINFAQDHLRILSGLHGVLRPLDRIQPYRLEMGTKLKYYSYTNLYQFWGDKITKRLNEDLNGSEYIINVASNEYFKVVNTKKLNAKVITPIFKDFSNGGYKVLMTYAKNARGAMARYIIKNSITDPEGIKGFNENGYAFDPAQSDESNYVFLRG